MIDLHCHFLPGVDDGARTIEDALALAVASVANGITHAVLTPHIHPGHFDNRLATLLPVFESYRASLRQAGIDLHVMLGGEVRLHPDALDLLVADDLPVVGAIGEDRVVLLEFPDGQIPAGAEVACRYFADRGVRWLIAHPERNKEVMRDPMRIKPFVDNGCLLQLTAASVIGRFGPHALQASHQLLAKGLVAVVATDSHNLLHRPPMLHEAREAIARLYGSGLAHRLTEETPAAIIASRLLAAA
jgi:protein-tyrosine phosphatase